METATSAVLIFATGRRRGGKEKTHEGLFHPYLVQRDKNQQRKFKEGKQRHDERQGCESKVSRPLYGLILLHQNGIQSSAIEGTKDKIHWHGIFPNNLLFGGILWLFTLLPG